MTDKDRGKYIRDRLVKLLRTTTDVAVYLSIFIYLLAFVSIFYAFYQGIAFGYDIYIGKKTLEKLSYVILSMLSNFLLAFVTMILARGVYQLMQRTQIKEEGGKAGGGLSEYEIEGIEKNFIGILVITMLLVSLQLLLSSQNGISILYTSLGVAAVVVASAIYLHCRHNS